MMYYAFKVGSEEYKLRLNTRCLIELEKELGYNPVLLFGDGAATVPTMEDMLKVFKAALKPYHKIQDEEIYTIFDSWIDEGHITSDFIYVIIEVYKVSGLVKDSKN